MKFNIRHFFGIGILAALAAFFYSIVYAEPSIDAAPASTTYFDESKTISSGTDAQVETGGWKKGSKQYVDMSKDLDGSAQAGSHRNPWRKNNTLGASHIVYPNKTPINGYRSVQ